MKCKLFLGSIVFATTAMANATLLTANFDSQTEGVFGSTLTDGGITFRNATWNIGGTTNFVIDDASTPFFPGFTAPNVCNFGGYAPGPGSGGGRIGRFEFGAGAASAASIDVFSFGDVSTTNSLTLVGYLGGSVVNTMTVAMGPSIPPVRYHLTLGPGSYDNFAVVGSGTTQGGDNFLAIDNVTIDTGVVPEPASFAVLGLGTFALIRRRKR